MIIQQKILLRRNIRGMENNNKSLKSFRDWWISFFNNHQFFCSVLASIVASIILTSTSIPNRFSTMENNIANIMNNIDNIDKKNKIIDDLSSKLQILETKYENIEKMTDKLDNRVYDINKYTPTSNMINTLSLSYNKSGVATISTPSWNSTDVIVTDDEKHIDITAKELANQTILLPYMENNQEVYFLGQFNKKNHWDGHCIINIYEDDYLIYIMDAVYDDGEIEFYKQMLPYTVKDSGDYVWMVSNRSFNGTSNIGESWSYFEDVDFYSKKIFNFNTVIAKDIISVEQFKDSITTPLESYYSGNTANGSYNDKTGNSYIVRYYNDNNENSSPGNLRILYYGNFVDSDFVDYTGNAWQIYYSPDDKSYVYCKGKFEANEYIGDDKSLITIDEIKQIIKDFDIKCELKWKEN